MFQVCSFSYFLKVVFNIVLKICQLFCISVCKGFKKGLSISHIHLLLISVWLHCRWIFLFLSIHDKNYFSKLVRRDTQVFSWTTLVNFFLWCCCVQTQMHPPSCPVFFFSKYLINVCGHAQWNRQGFKISLSKLIGNWRRDDQQNESIKNYQSHNQNMFSICNYVHCLRFPMNNKLPVVRDPPFYTQTPRYFPAYILNEHYVVSSSKVATR